MFAKHPAEHWKGFDVLGAGKLIKLGGTMFIAFGFGGFGGTEARARGERERDKRLRALGYARGHTPGYIGVGDQVALRTATMPPEWP